MGFAATSLAQPADTTALALTAIRGMQDTKAAARFFRQNAAMP